MSDSSKQDSLASSQKDLIAAVASKAVDPVLVNAKGAEASRSLSSPKQQTQIEKTLPSAAEPSRSIPSNSSLGNASSTASAGSTHSMSNSGADRPIDTVDIDVSLADSESDTDLSHTSGSDSSSANTPKNELRTPKNPVVTKSDSKHADLTTSPRITTRTAKDATEGASLAPPAKNRKTQRHSRLSANSAAVESTILAPLLRLRNHTGVLSSEELHQTLNEAVGGLSKLLKRCSSTSTEFLLQQLRKENQENAQQMDANTRRWLFSTLVEDDYVSDAVARELQLPNNLQLPAPSPVVPAPRSIGDTPSTPDSSAAPNLSASPPMSVSARKPIRSRHVKFASMVAPRISENVFSALDHIRLCDSPVDKNSPRDGERRPSRLELVTGSRRFLDGLRQKTEALVPSRNLEPTQEHEQPRSADPVSSAAAAASSAAPARSLRRSNSNDDLLSSAKRHFNFDAAGEGKKSPDTPPEVKAKELLRSSDELSMTPRLNSPHRMNSLSNDTSFRPLSFTSVGIFSDALGRVHLAEPPHDTLNPENAALYRQKGIIYGFQTSDLFRVHRSPPTGLKGAAPIVEEAKPGDWVIISDEDGIGVCPKSEFSGQYEAIAGKRNMYRKSSCALAKVIDAPHKPAAPSPAASSSGSTKKPELSVTVPQRVVLVRLLDAISCRQLSNAIGVAWANVKQSLPTTEAQMNSPPSSVRTLLSSSTSSAEYFLFDQQYFEDKFLPAKGATRTSILSVMGSPRATAAPPTPVELMSPANPNRTRQFSAMFDNVFLPKSVKHAIEHQLDRSLDWTFDIFALDRLSDGHTLYYLGFYMFEAFDLIEKFDISENSLKNFLYEMEAAYKANPYHNSIHGADVMQSTIHFVRHGINLMTPKSATKPAALPPIDEQNLSPSHQPTAVSDLQFLALVLSALMHDVAHPGLTNNFLVNTDHALALEYNDKSVLENFHIATGFGILRKENCNILSNVSPTQRKELRAMMIKLVLATDLAFHFDTLTQFKAKWLTNELQPSDPQSQILLMKIALKCADIGHPLKPQPIHLKWSQRCFEEFYNQGDEERSRGLPITACCDRYDKKEGKSQKGFLDFLVRPLITAFCDVVGNKMWLSYLEQNDQYWSAKLKAAEAKEASLRSAVLQRAAATQGALQLPEPRPSSAGPESHTSAKSRKTGHVPRNVPPTRALPHSMSTDLKAARGPLSLTQHTAPKPAVPTSAPPPASTSSSSSSSASSSSPAASTAAPSAPAHPVRMITSKSDGAPASPSPPGSPPSPSPTAPVGSLASQTPSETNRRDSQSGKHPVLMKAPTIPSRPADPSASQKKRQYVDELRRAFSNPRLELTVSEDAEDGSEPPSGDAKEAESKPQPKLEAPGAPKT